MELLYSRMLKKVYQFSVTIELLLFPWINSKSDLDIIFYGLFGINILLGVYFYNSRKRNLSKMDFALLVFILITLLNPETYWQEFGITAAYVRMAAFGLRYFTLINYSISKSYRTLAIGVLISSIGAIAGWLYGYGDGDDLRLNYPYGDSNYQGFIYSTYAILLMVNICDKKINKLIGILGIISSLLIVILGASRGSIIALIITGFIFVLQKFSFKKIILVVFLITIPLYSLSKTEIYKDLLIIDRLMSPGKSDIGAASSRLTEIRSGLKYFSNSPLQIIYGFGLSSSSDKNSLFNFKIRIHNTPMAIFFDGGIIGVISIMLLFFWSWQKLRDSNGKYLLIFIFLNSLTVYLITFYHFILCLKLIQERKSEH